jgi:ATP adenylyltransferase
MENMWAPWRAEYILSPKDKECIFCNALNQNKDRDNLVLHRGKNSFIIMNRYPYNSGHLMISPNAHKARLDELDQAEYTEIWQLLTLSADLLTSAMPAEGLNVGINLGETAGSSIREHLHVHIVPRFTGDTNFMPVLGQTKIQSFALLETYDALKKHLDKLLKK